jgi:hypothetical protein
MSKIPFVAAMMIIVASLLSPSSANARGFCTGKASHYANFEACFAGSTGKGWTANAASAFCRRYCPS